MGNKSIGPCTDKKIYTGSNAKLDFITCEMQGWREYMEDATLCITEFDKDCSLFGIFDGHGGQLISKFSAANFKTLFQEYYSRKDQGVENSLIQTFMKLDELLVVNDVNEFLKKQYNNNTVDLSFNIKNYIKTKTAKITANKLISISDQDSLNKTKNTTVSTNNVTNEDSNDHDEKIKSKFNSEDSKERKQKISISQAIKKSKDYVAYYMGTTANVIFIEGNYMYVANVGDSYSVMFKNKLAVKLNSEHKTCIPAEEQRINKAGLRVINSRVEGKLNLTRAIGDLCFKGNTSLKSYEQGVTCFPEINKFELTDDIEFIIMGCDGIWDCVEVQKFCEFISNNLRNKNMPINLLMPFLLDKLLSKTREAPIGTDNMSITLLVFNRNNESLLKNQNQIEEEVSSPNKSNSGLHDITEI